jgi:hypothetical protein
VAVHAKWRPGDQSSVCPPGPPWLVGADGLRLQDAQHLMDDERRKRRSEELLQIVPGLSADQVAHAVDRWCSMLGLSTSMDKVDRGTFADFRATSGLVIDGEPARV